MWRFAEVCFKLLEHSNVQRDLHELRRTDRTYNCTSSTKARSFCMYYWSVLAPKTFEEAHAKIYIDAKPASLEFGRADALNARTQQYLEVAGLLAELLPQGLKCNSE